MTFFLTLGLVGIGAECNWPVVTIRLLLIQVGIAFGGLIESYNRALNREKDRLSAARGVTLGLALSAPFWLGLALLAWWLA